MALTQAIPEAPQPIPIFNFEDIASGFGVIVFFAAVTDPASGDEFILTTSQNIWSSKITTTRTDDGTTTLIFNSSPFNLPRYAKGTAFFSCGLGMSSNPVGSASAQVFHVTSGGSETNITSKIISDVKAQNASRMILLELPITEKHFKKGEKLRLKVELIKAGGVEIEIGHSPQNLDGPFLTPSLEEITSVMRVLMPFRIDQV